MKEETEDCEWNNQPVMTPMVLDSKDPRLTLQPKVRKTNYRKKQLLYLYSRLLSVLVFRSYISVSGSFWSTFIISASSPFSSFSISTMS